MSLSPALYFFDAVVAGLLCPHGALAPVSLSGTAKRFVVSSGSWEMLKQLWVGLVSCLHWFCCFQLSELDRGHLVGVVDNLLAVDLLCCTLS